MRNVPADLREAWRSLAEAEGDSPGYDYDRGYLTGWYYARRGKWRVMPDGDYRDPERVAEFRLGYAHGKEDGVGKPMDWWPDYAQGLRPMQTSPKTARPASIEAVPLSTSTGGPA